MSIGQIPGVEFQVKGCPFSYSIDVTILPFKGLYPFTPLVSKITHLHTPLSVCCPLSSTCTFKIQFDNGVVDEQEGEEEWR